MSSTALQRAIEIAGGQKSLAEKIRSHLNRPTFSQQTVSYWVRKNTLIEAEYWPAIEAATDNLVTRQDIRPDVFPEAVSERA